MQRQTQQGPETRSAKVTGRVAAAAGVTDGVPTRTPSRLSSPTVPGTAARAASRAATLLLALLCLLAPFAAGGQTTVKSIEGKVLSSASAPLAGSVIYLQDTRSNVIKTLIAPADGAYHFGQLPADTDYQIWAEYKGKKSKVRLISSFDTKRDVTHDFHIDK